MVRVRQTTSLCEAVGYDTITVISAPIVTLTHDAATDTLCSGGEITFTAHVGTGFGDGTYTWFRNGVVIEGANGEYLTESPLAVDGDSTAYNYGLLKLLTQLPLPLLRHLPLKFVKQLQIVQLKAQLM